MEKKSLVSESVDSFINESNRSGWVSPEDAAQMYIEAIESAGPVEEAMDNIRAVFDEHPYMHEELGEVDGRDYYHNSWLEAEKILLAKYPGT